MPLADFIAPTFGFGGASLGAFGLWHAQRAKTRADDDDSVRDDTRAGEQAVDARWQAMLEQQRTDFNLVLEPIRSDLAELRSEVGALRVALDRTRALYRTALDHILTLRRLWPERTATLPALPVNLEREV